MERCVFQEEEKKIHVACVSEKRENMKIMPNKKTQLRDSWEGSVLSISVSINRRDA